MEDNVRAPVESCARIVTQAREASENWSAEKGIECHFRFIGWLGSLTNLEYLLHTHAKKRAFPVASRGENGNDSPSTTEQIVGVCPFPLLSHVASDFEDFDVPETNGAGEDENGEDKKEAPDIENDDEEDDDDKTSGTRHSRPGGNFMYVKCDRTF